MKLNLIETKEILDLEKEIGYELIVNERPIKPGVILKPSKYYVQFEHSEIMENGCLAGKYGNGNTIDEAIQDYCRIISNCRVAFNAFTTGRKEVQLQKLVHTKLLGK